MDQKDISEYASDISALMQERLRVKAPSLARQVHKSGRVMPKKIKKAAQRVAQASMLNQNPKLARQIDAGQIERDAQAVISYLQTIDPTEALKDKILITLAKYAALLIVIFILVIWYAYRAGHI